MVPAAIACRNLVAVTRVTCLAARFGPGSGGNLRGNVRRGARHSYWCALTVVMRPAFRFACASDRTRADVAPALPSISHNIELNNVTSWARPMEVDWLKAEAHVKALPPADIILAADVVWVEELVLPFVETLSRSLHAARAANGPGIFCLLCHKTRSRHTDEMLLQGLSREGLSAVLVPGDELHPAWSSSELILWRIRIQEILDVGCFQ